MSNINRLNDEELMKEYQRGDEKAFMILYEKHSAKVYGFLLSRLRDKAFADDVFQATFLKLHQARSKYDATLPFLPWLFTVCRSVMIDNIRKKNRVLEENDPDSIELAAAPEVTESAVMPNLAGLPENHRKVLELRYESDMSFEEIARRLETTPLNVRQITSRAVRKLRAMTGKGNERK